MPQQDDPSVRQFKRTSRVLTFGTRHPRAALAIWLAATLALTIVGLNVGSHLNARNALLVPGSQSAREADRFEQQFGSSVSAPVVLTGPGRALNREGPRLVRKLARLPGAQVVSAWDGGTLGRSLRPAPGRALVLVAITRSGANAHGATNVDSVQTVVNSTLTAPVHGRVSGVDAIAGQLQSASLTAVHRAELIAIPVLLLVLLIVFGSPLAAVIPALLGFGTVLSGFGVIALLGSLMSLNELATTAASMMGLALGVDYSLLVVARFRDELTDPGNPDAVAHAATMAALRAGRTVAFAGGAIAILMAFALSVAAGTLLVSAVIGVIVVAAISVAGTVLATPAALTLFGGGVAYRFWGGRSPPTHAAEHALPSRDSWTLRAGSSVPVVLICALALGLVGWRALSLQTGPPSAGELPSSSAAAHNYNSVVRTVGTGWVTPFEMLVVVPHGAVTTLPLLNAMASAQRQIAADGDVTTVIGPAELARRAAPLAHAEASVAATNRNLKRSAAAIGGLNSSLGKAASGASSVQSGFAKATAAVQRLASGGGGGSAGVQALQSGLAQAANGSRQIDAGLSQAASAAGKIANGSQTIASGSSSLVSAISTEAAAASAAQPKLNALATALSADAKAVGGLTSSVQQLAAPPTGVASALTTALDQLQSMRLGRLDPRYRSALAAVQAAQSALSQTPSTTALTNQIQQDSSSLQQAGGQVASLAGAAGSLAGSAARVQVAVAGLPGRIAALEQGQRSLASGIQKLATSGAALTNGIGSLSSGTAALTAKLAALQSGAAQVASSLSGGQQQVQQLTSALSSGQTSARNGASTTPSNAPLLGTLAHNPGFFGSGYLILAALEGSAAARRAGINFIVNVARNGQAARMIVVPSSGVRAAATGALRSRLQAIADGLGARTGSVVLLGGPAAQLRDYAADASNRVPLLIAVLTLVTFVLLMVVFRSLVAPLVTVLLNLLSVGAAFGILSLLTRGRHPLIGGPGYVDALSVSAMFAVVFALSLDYQVFLLMRMREGFQRTGSTSAGVDYGVARTARVVAGAAAIMAGVFLAFATANVATIRQLGVGLAAAILIDATIVRLVLLPFLLRIGGERTWWLPAALASHLPVLDIGSERRALDRPPEPTVIQSAPGRNQQPPLMLPAQVPVTE
jgi:RND superfamily putative drug exporter